MLKNCIISSSDGRDIKEVPKIPLATFLLQNLRKNLCKYGSQQWVVDPRVGTSVRFDEVDEQSRKIASALHKHGFRRGHVLYFVTYEMAQLFVIQLAVWRLGGAVRGNYQTDTPEEYVRQMSESHAEFVLVDVDTSARVREAISQLEWSVQLFGVGLKPVDGAVNVTDMLLDDGEACPDEVEINVHEDVAIIPNTSGSTGFPKGVLLSHYALVAHLVPECKSFSGTEPRIMYPMPNYMMSSFIGTVTCLRQGITAIHLGCFDTNTYFENIKKFKPGSLLMYPYIAKWFIRSSQLDNADLSCLKFIGLGGSVLDPTTAKMFTTRLPNVKINQLYGMTECLTATATEMCQKSYGCLPVIENQGELFVSSGTPMSYTQIKVVDLETRTPLMAGQRGEILVKSPFIMRGYLTDIVRNDAQPDRSKIDDEGWLQTGDMGFYDEFGNLYMIERINFIFKYFMTFVLPSEIEAVLQEHEAVHYAGVVGVPNDDTTNLARAYVVIRSGCDVTADQLIAHVAARLPDHMQLHGGVRFLEKLPQNRGGKIDRVALKELAMRDLANENVQSAEEKTL